MKALLAKFLEDMDPDTKLVALAIAGSVIVSVALIIGATITGKGW